MTSNLDIAREAGAVIYTHRGEPPSSVGFTAATLDAFVSRIRAKDQDLIDRLKMEAQINAQEARTANATIADIYQLCTGATGEPGNWHGAEPVREALERIRADEREKCAMVCDDRLSCVRPVGPRHAERPYKNGLTDAYKDCAAAIIAQQEPTKPERE